MSGVWVQPMHDINHGVGFYLPIAELFSTVLPWKNEGGIMGRVLLLWFCLAEATCSIFNARSSWMDPTMLLTFTLQDGSKVHLVQHFIWNGGQPDIPWQSISSSCWKQHLFGLSVAILVIIYEFASSFLKSHLCYWLLLHSVQWMPYGVSIYFLHAMNAIWSN